MKSILFLVIGIALTISTECASSSYTDSAEESSNSGIVRICMNQYEHQEHTESQKSLLDCEHLKFLSDLIPMTPSELIELINNAKALLMLIEDVRVLPVENAKQKLIELARIVVHQADTPLEVADEPQFGELVHIILRLKSQFERHFPSEANVPAWGEFLSKHQTIVDAIAMELKPNAQALVDFMNSNYASFTNQIGMMTRFTELYDGVFNAFYMNEKSAEMESLKPAAWALFFNVLSKSPQDSNAFKTLSRYNRTTFFAVNYEQLMDLTGNYLYLFLNDVENFLKFSKIESALTLETFPMLNGIVDRYEIAIAMALRLDDFLEEKSIIKNTFAAYCNYAMAQFNMELKYDRRLKDNAKFIALQRRLEGSMELIKERKFPKDQLLSKLGAPYDDLNQPQFEKYLIFQSKKVKKAIADYDDSKNASVSAAIVVALNDLLHNAAQIKLEKRLHVRREQLYAMQTLCSDFFRKFSDPDLPEYQLVQVIEESFKRIFRL